MPFLIAKWQNQLLLIFSFYSHNVKIKNSRFSPSASISSSWLAQRRSSMSEHTLEHLRWLGQLLRRMTPKSTLWTSTIATTKNSACPSSRSARSASRRSSQSKNRRSKHLVGFWKSYKYCDGEKLVEKPFVCLCRHLLIIKLRHFRVSVDSNTCVASKILKLNFQTNSSLTVRAAHSTSSSLTQTKPIIRTTTTRLCSCWSLEESSSSIMWVFFSKIIYASI